MPNVFEPDRDEPRDQPGVRSRRAPIGQQLGADRLGMTLWELPPGQAAYPYRVHLAEEVPVVLASAQGTAEVVVHPDTDRVAVPDRRRDGAGLRASFRRADADR